MVPVQGLIDDVIILYQSGEKRYEMGNISIHGDNAHVIIQQTKQGDAIMEEKSENKNKKEIQRSSWANGSFYLFCFIIVIGGLGFLSGFVPFYTLAIIIVAGILIVPIIGALQLRQDKNLTEKSFIELIKIVLMQLPIIRKLTGKGKQKHLNE
jgi:internalin A